MTSLSANTKNFRACGREYYQFRSKTCKCKQIIIYSDVIHKMFAILSVTYHRLFSCSGYKSSLLREEGTDFWPKNRFFYRFKLLFSPFSSQKPIPNVKIFI